MKQDRRRFGCLIVDWFGITLLVSAGCAQTPDKPPAREEVAQLFDRWNVALQTGQAEEVVKLYAPDAILLPTISNKVRRNHAEIKDYFEHFLHYQPVGRIDE